MHSDQKGRKKRSRRTFEHIATWLSEAKAQADENIVFALVGNKADLEGDRQVSSARDTALAQRLPPV